MPANVIPDPLVRNPREAFGPYDLTSTFDRCINCEERKKIKTIITMDQKSGPICVKCFRAYQGQK